MHISRSHIVVRNTLYNFSYQIWCLLIGLLITPYIVRKLGLDVFGLFSIVPVVIGYFRFLGFGFSNAITKYISEYYVKKDIGALKRTIGTGLIIYALMGFLGMGLIISSSGLFINKVLHIPSHLIGLARFIFIIQAIIFFCGMLLNVYDGIMRALQRYDIINKINTYLLLLQSGLTVLFLFLGLSLKEILLLYLMITILNLLISYVISRKLLPQVKMGFIFNHAIFNKLSRFSFFDLLSQIAGQIVFQFDKLLIGLFLSLTSITYYIIPFNLANTLNSLMFNLQIVLLPVASELSSIGSRASFKQMYIRSVKTSTLITMPLAICLFIFARPILLLWMGEEIAQRSTVILRILSTAFLVSSATGIPSIVTSGAGRPDIVTIFSWSSAIISLSFSLILIPRYGLNGAALSMAINIFAQSPLFIWYVTKNIVKLDVLDFFRKSILKPVVIGLFVGLIFSSLSGFINNFLSLFLAMGSVVIAYFLLIYQIGALDIHEKNTIKSYINNLYLNIHSKLYKHRRR